MTSTQQATAEEPESHDEYEVRWFADGDAADLRTLFAASLERDWSLEHVEWKYREDPFLDHAPVNVVERDGEIVGAQAYVPVPLRYGDAAGLALQPADAVVREDHRRNGLYTRLTEQAIERYAAGEPSAFFNYPNPGALSAQADLGWTELGDLAVYYRVQRPAALLPVAAGLGVQLAARAAGRVARAGLGALDAVGPAAGDLTVTRHADPPAETLAALYRRSVPDGLHVRRTAAYYEWWFSDPGAEHATYVARRDGAPVAALVARTPPQGVLQLREALPLGSDRPTGALGRLVAAALADHRDAHVVKTAGATLPRSLLRRFGFVRDDAPLLDRATTPLTVAARPLADGGEPDPIAEAVADRSNWRPTFLEVDRD